MSTSSCQMMDKAWAEGKADAEQGKPKQNFENATYYASFYIRGYDYADMKRQFKNFAGAVKTAQDNTSREYLK